MGDDNDNKELEKTEEREGQVEPEPVALVLSAREKLLAEKAKKYHVSGIIELLKIGAQSAPYAGALAGILEDVFPNKRWQRLEKFAQDTVSCLGQFAERIDEEMVNKEEVERIFEELIERVPRCTSEEKIECYKAILINSILPNDMDEEVKIYYLNVVDSLTPLHISMLAILKNPQAFASPAGHEPVATLQRVLKNIDKDVVQGAYNRLHELGFVGVQPDQFTHLIGTDLHEIGHRLTSGGKKFIQFITLED